MATKTVIDRHALVLQRVTLNGYPAQISGIRDEFAIIRALRAECPAAQFAWDKVDFIVRSTGQFES